jgi:hypothetical protein
MKAAFGIGFIRTLWAIAYVPHDLEDTGDLAFEALLDGNGKRHVRGLSYRWLRSRDSAPSIGQTTGVLGDLTAQDKVALLVSAGRQRPLQLSQHLPDADSRLHTRGGWTTLVL